MGKYETAGAKEWDRSRKLHKQVIKKRKQRQAESREAGESEPEAGPRVPYGTLVIRLVRIRYFDSIVQIYRVIAAPKVRNKESLTIQGTECNAHRAPAQYAEQEARTLLMPYGGDANNLIDRLGCRLSAVLHIEILSILVTFSRWQIRCKSYAPGRNHSSSCFEKFEEAVGK